MKYELKNVMTIAEAADRWNLSHNTLSERFKMRTKSMQDDIEKALEDGTVKRYKAVGKTRYDWFLTTDKMESWYGSEPTKK